MGEDLLTCHWFVGSTSMFHSPWEFPGLRAFLGALPSEDGDDGLARCNVASCPVPEAYGCK